MKKIVYGVITIIYLLSFYGCGGGNNQKTVERDTAKVSTSKENPDEKKGKHLAFLSDSLRMQIENNIEAYAAFRKKFDIVPLDKFNQFSSDFNSMFNTSIPPPNPTNNHYLPMPFSIYEKYHGFQVNRNLQLPEYETTENGTLKKFKNQIRIYPAIDANNNFYLVFLRELQSIPATPYPTTDRDVYYSIRYNSPFGTNDVQFSAISSPDTPQANKDILKFQSSLKTIAAAHKPALTFREERSFSYTITDYDELIDNPFPYWDIAGAKNDQNSNIVVRIFPGIDKDDANDVRFRLMLKLFRLTPGGYKEIAGKAIFDNMDPCPNACPDASSDIHL